MDKMGELKSLLEGQVSFTKWKADQIKTLGTAHAAALMGKEVDHDHRLSH